MITAQAKSQTDQPFIRIESSGPLAFRLKELWDYRELLFFLVWRDVKVRYKQTAIGAAWTVIQPLLTMAVFTVVFQKFARMPSNGVPYPLFIFTALLPWSYFSKALNSGIQSLVGNANLITKVYFPRLLLPISAILSGLIDFAISFLFLVGMMVWFGFMPGIRMLVVPLFLFLTVLTALAIGLWLAVINVRYRDVGQAIPFVVQLWLFASPVAYPISVVPEKWRLLYSLNPMTGVIEGFRWALLGKPMPDILPVIISIVVVLALLFAGIMFFRRMEETFADIV